MSGRHGARVDGTFTDDQKVQLFRRIHCDGAKITVACREMGCSVTTYNTWKHNPEWLERAQELGPTGEGGGAEAPPAGDADDIFANLPPIGQEKPDSPSPEFMAILADRYGVHQDPARLDRLAAWPAGSVQLWFDRAQRGDRECAIRVAILQRAAEIKLGQVENALLASGNAKALKDFLVARGVLSEQPEQKRNAAEGHTQKEIDAEIVRRAKAREAPV